MTGRRKRHRAASSRNKGPTSLTRKIPQNHLGRLFLARDLLLQLHSKGSGTALPPALEVRLVSLEDRTWALLGCPPGPGGASFPSVTLSPRLGDAQGLPLWGCPESHSPLQAPGLLVGAQTAHSTVPGTAADTGVGGGEAADSTEGALGPGRGSRTGRQVVRALGHAQVLLLQQGLKVFSEAEFKMITSCFLLFLS